MLLDRYERPIRVLLDSAGEPVVFIAEPAPDLAEPPADERWELLYPLPPDVPPEG